MRFFADFDSISRLLCQQPLLVNESSRTGDALFLERVLDPTGPQSILSLSPENYSSGSLGSFKSEY